MKHDQEQHSDNRHSRQDAQTSALEAFTIGDPDRVWTVREIAKHAAIGGRGPVVVGSELVAPELQRRGRYKRDYAPGTLREKLYGQGRARLGADHPAVRFRNIADLPGS